MIAFRFFSSALLLLCASFSLHSQVATFELHSIHTAYFAPFGIEPGAKFGVSFSNKNWSMTKKKTKNEKTKVTKHQFLVSPQIAWFNKRYYNQNLVFNTDFTWRWQRTGKKSNHALSVGLGYNYHSEALTLTTDFEGNLSVSEWERRNYFMPSISYTFGRSFYKKLGFYLKPSLGYSMSSTHINVAELFAEVGLTYDFPRSNQKN